MRLLFPVVVLASCCSLACATGVDDGTGGGTKSDTSGPTDDTGGGNDTSTDAAKDSTLVDARDSATADARDTSSGGDAGDDGADSTIDDTATDIGTIDVGTDTAKADTSKVDSGGVDSTPTDAGVGTLLISEVQTRGSAGGNDEFIELYNPGSTAISFDSTWTIAARSAAGTCASNAQAIRYTGTGQVVGPHRHLLLTNSAGYDGTVVGDDTYATGVNDASSLVLYHGTTVVDAVCFYVDPASLANLSVCPGAPYTCEGSPVTNLPHNNGTSGLSNTDVTIDRKPGGAAGNGTDTGDSSSDFTAAKLANPQNLSSAAAP